MVLWMQVWLVAYRSFEQFTADTIPNAADLVAGSPLQFPSCLNPRMQPMLEPFQPCQAVAHMSALTEESTSDAEESVHLVTFDVAATIYPGMSELDTIQQTCHYIHIFGLSSSTIGLYLIAEDQNRAVAFDSECDTGETASEESPGVWRRLCRCDSLITTAYHLSTGSRQRHCMLR